MKANSVPIVDRAVEEEVAAVAEHDRGRDRREEVDEREVEAVRTTVCVVRLAVVRVDLAEVALVRGSRVNAWTTRMPAMSSASVAVTMPSRSRTAR